MLYEAEVTVCSWDKYETSKHCGQNLQLLNIKPVGTSRNL
jgi:hypothetical protein